MRLFVSAAGRLIHNRATAQGSWVVFATLAAVGLACFPSRASSQVVDLRPAAGVGSLRQVRVVVASEGKLKLNADGQEVKHLPLKVEGELVYGERVLAQAKNWTESRQVRAFHAASAKIQLHQTELKSELRAERRLVGVESSETGAVAYSIGGPLTREELELIEPPASGLALEALLPPRAIKSGSQWPLNDAMVARLLGLEAVSQHDVAGTLEAAKDGVALITLAGKVSGAAGGVSSDCELKAKLNFDLNKRAVTWFTLAVKENRAIGHAKPGFEVLTTVRMVAEPVRQIAGLDDKALAGRGLRPGAGATLIEMTSEGGGFRLHHDRRWSVMFERPDLTVLRFVDRGDLIAQCNITPRADLPADKQLSMEGFQAEVKRVLGNNFEEIVEAAEETDEAGRRILRVVVAGKTGDLPIQWTYYDVSDDKGRRASLVFTIEASLLERFAAIDREFLSGFEFRALKDPTPADTKAAAAIERTQQPR